VKLTAAFLADAAQVTAGKLYVLGGAFDTITARRFPAVHRSLAVVLVAEVGPGDRNRDLPIRIELLDEDGGELGIESQGNLRVGAPSALPAGASSLVPLVSAFGNVRFPAAGGYVFRISHEDAEIGRIPFRVREPA
jgi:hypothetical protein